MSGNPDVDRSTIEIMLRAMVAVNRAWLRRNPAAPHLYDAGARYIREPQGGGYWMDYGEILRRGGADCEDLATALVAWYQETGQEPYASIQVLEYPDQTTDMIHWHVVVRRRDGTIEDPSRVLGMEGVA